MADDENNQNTGAGRTLGGGAAEPLPASWRTSTSQPRVGRIGGPSTLVYGTPLSVMPITQEVNVL